MRYRLSESKRENDRLNEQLAYPGPSDSGRREVDKVMEQQDQLKTRIIELKREKQSILDKLMGANQTIERLKSDKPVDQRTSELQVRVEGKEGEGEREEEEGVCVWGGGTRERGEGEGGGRKEGDEGERRRGWRGQRGEGRGMRERAEMEA